MCDGTLSVRECRSAPQALVLQRDQADQAPLLMCASAVHGKGIVRVENVCTVTAFPPRPVAGVRMFFEIWRSSRFQCRARREDFSGQGGLDQLLDVQLAEVLREGKLLEVHLPVGRDIREDVVARLNVVQVQQVPLVLPCPFIGMFPKVSLLRHRWIIRHSLCLQSAKHTAYCLPVNIRISYHTLKVP